MVAAVRVWDVPVCRLKKNVKNNVAVKKKKKKGDRWSVPAIGTIIGHLDRQEPQPLCGGTVVVRGCSAILVAQEPQLLDGGCVVVCGGWLFFVARCVFLAGFGAFACAGVGAGCVDFRRLGRRGGLVVLVRRWGWGLGWWGRGDVQCVCCGCCGCGVLRGVFGGGGWGERWGRTDGCDWRGGDGVAGVVVVVVGHGWGMVCVVRQCARK